MSLKAQDFDVQSIYSQDSTFFQFFGTQVSYSNNYMLVLDDPRYVQLKHSEIFIYQRNNNDWIYKQTIEQDSGLQFLRFTNTDSVCFIMTNGNSPYQCCNIWSYEIDSNNYWKLDQVFHSRRYAYDLAIEGNLAAFAHWTGESLTNPRAPKNYGLISVFTRDSTGKWSWFQDVRSNNDSLKSKIGKHISISNGLLFMSEDSKMHIAKLDSNGLFSIKQTVEYQFPDSSFKNSYYTPEISVHDDHFVVSRTAGYPFEGNYGVQFYDKSSGTWKMKSSFYRSVDNPITYNSPYLTISENYAMIRDYCGSGQNEECIRYLIFKKNLDNSWSIHDKIIDSTVSKGDYLQVYEQTNPIQFVINVPDQTLLLKDTSILHTGAMKIFASQYLNINEYQTEIRPFVYPNPSNGIFVIDLDTDVSEIQVVDFQGKVRYVQNGISSGPIQIDISDQSAGIYILRVRTDSGIVSSKLVKFDN